ncbi:hypothetical protein C3729_10935 [Cloacibacterium normanense]|uniref:Uncharacterized protein n=1 Tax=Cloacibacterium normanense TaxID=237258 RepID=A0A2S7I2Y9_9FLAO|nr:hypothetical protein [Cloacibacterium normanense]PPZ90927.1 hypothetical protein C3729_10935 [Cloacibacterium normanense]
MRLSILIILVLLNSCGRIIEQNQFNSELNNYNSPYQGTWYGIYSGSGINSTFTLKVYKAGNVEVIRNIYNSSETFYGQVFDNGVLNSVYSQNSEFTLNGSLATKSGTWKQNNLSGNWTINKQ